MAKKIEKLEELTATGEELFNIYDIVDAIDETDNAVKIKSLIEAVTEQTIILRIQKLQLEIDDLNNIIIEIDKVKIK